MAVAAQLSETDMNKLLAPDEIRQLSVADRLQLIEELWDSLDEADLDSADIPEWQQRVIDGRLAAFERDPSAGRPWIEVKEDILQRLRK